MLKYLKINFILSMVLFIGIPIGLNSNKNFEQIDGAFDLQEERDLSSLSTKDLKELAVKAEQIAKIMESSDKVKKLQEAGSVNKKFLWLAMLKSHLLNNFIVDGVTDGLKDIVKTVIVPETVRAALILAIISKFTGIPFPDLVMFIWRIVFPRKLPYPKDLQTGPMEFPIPDFGDEKVGYFDTSVVAIMKTWNALPWVGNATTVD